MANYQRTDPGSLSFGRRLANAERDAAQAKAELAQLKQTLPASQDLRGAAMAADAIKQQRKSAKQLMARADVTLEDLQGIDPNVLTPMFQEQLRLTKRDAAFREMPMQQQGFAFQSEQAQQRFVTWQQQASSGPIRQDFYKNNVSPGQSKPQRPFDVWAARQDSPAGRFERNRKNQQELDRSHMLTQLEAQRFKPKAKGRTLGRLKDLNE